MPDAEPPAESTATEEKAAPAPPQRPKGPLANAVANWADTTQTRLKSGTRLPGLPTGFKGLDEITSGMHRGDLTIVAGRPGVGKTSLALNIAVNACFFRLACDGPKSVLVFTPGVPTEQTLQRIFAIEARVDLQNIRTQPKTDDDWQRLAQVAAQLVELPLHIDDRASMTPDDIRARAYDLRKDLALVVVDSISDVIPETPSEWRDRELGDIVRALKRMARELRVPVLATCGLARTAPRDKVPRIDDVRGFGDVEDHADVVLLLHRDDLINPRSTRPKVADIQIAKQRMGPLHTEYVWFFGQWGLFSEQTKQEDNSNEGSQPPT